MPPAERTVPTWAGHRDSVCPRVTEVELTGLERDHPVWPTLAEMWRRHPKQDPEPRTEGGVCVMRAFWGRQKQGQEPRVWEGSPGLWGAESRVVRSPSGDSGPVWGQNQNWVHRAECPVGVSPTQPHACLSSINRRTTHELFLQVHVRVPVAAG